MIRTLGLAALFLLGTAVLCNHSDARDGANETMPEKKGLAGELDRLIGQLDSDSFEVREKATARLEVLGEKVLPALAKVGTRGTAGCAAESRAGAGDSGALGLPRLICNWFCSRASSTGKLNGLVT